MTLASSKNAVWMSVLFETYSHYELSKFLFFIIRLGHIVKAQVSTSSCDFSSLQHLDVTEYPH